MVRGLDLFGAHFKKYSDHYTIIGGVAASEWFSINDFPFRITKDIDIVLFFEAVDVNFTGVFWEFIRLAQYEIKERGDGKRIFYRFARPANDSYPYMLEVFSRPDNAMLPAGDQTIIPIKATEDSSSLSAILMDADYYSIVQNFREIRNNLPLLTVPGLILLKAKAWEDLSSRRSAGERIDSKQIKKHRNDIFRLASLLKAGETHKVPAGVYQDFQAFFTAFPPESEEWQGIKSAIGSSSLSVDSLMTALGNAFEIE